MDCQLDAVFAALDGAPPADVRMVAPPFGPPLAPPPPDAKGVYGGSLDHHVDTANFTVQWTDPAVDPDRAQAIADALEMAWTRLVEQGGWPAPVSADRWLLWVILDPELGGSGWTTDYVTEDYPQGYPVMYVNPDYVPETPEFGLSVAVHEFGHALQFAVRDWASPGSETWFWEASAEWMAEQGGPDFDTYAWSTWYYAEATTLAWDSVDHYHQYGMVLLPAYLDQFVWGGEGLRAAWEDNRGRAWEEVVVDWARAPVAELVQGMAAAYAAGALRESRLYWFPEVEAVALPATLDVPERYGTLYVALEGEPGELRVDGPVRASFGWADGWSLTPPAEGPFVAAFTATGDAGGTFTVAWEAAEPDDDDDGDDGVTDGWRDPEPAGCGCGTGAPAGAGAALFGLAALRRRVRPSRAP